MRKLYPSYAEIDLNLFHQNIDLIHETAQGAKLIPVIKANAYGHGAITLARELCKREDVEALAVGVVSEAVQLQKAGIKKRMLVIDGILPEQTRMAVELNLEPVVSNIDEAKRFARLAGPSKISIHFKLNTGMARLGVDLQPAFELYKKINGMKKLSIAGIMTHFASADSNDPFTNGQIEKFDDFCKSLKAAGTILPPRHAANTAGIFRHSDSCYELVRPGLGLYGVQEFEGPDVGLAPVLSWRTRIIMTRALSKGEPVSYNMAWTSPGKRRVALAMTGYADGYNRALSSKWQAIINGIFIPQVGAICMDSSFFDVTRTKASIGDVITLLGSDGGKSISAVDMARELGTIAYEVLCLIGSRTPRFYLKSGRVVSGPEK